MQFQDFNDEYFNAREKDMYQRFLMHELDRRFIRKLISEDFLGEKSILLDIGCSDGTFVYPFIQNGWEVYGIEPNIAQQKLAIAKGVKIVEHVSEIPQLDLVVIRGTLHHLPDWEASLDEIFTKFQISPIKKSKWLFILAEPNADSWIFQKFGKLPAVEENPQFGSNYRIFSSQELNEYFVKSGAVVHVQYPYLKTPYRKFWRDLLKVSRMFFLKRYERTPWFGNMFNMAVEMRFYAQGN